MAYEDASGRVGAAVASCVLAIGSRALHAHSGAGLIVVQGGGWAEDSTVAFSSLTTGSSAKRALLDLRRLERPGAQYAVATAGGQLDAWTATGAAPWSGHDVRRAVSVQGNTLVDEQVVQACHQAWAVAGDQRLEERLLSSLAAGVAAGGDLRGQQSAALLSVGSAPGSPQRDLRVDDAADPVGRLREMLPVLRAHELLQLAWGEVAADAQAAAGAMRHAVELAPQDGLVAQTAAVVFMQAGMSDQAAERWRVALRTIPDSAARLSSWRNTLPWVAPGVLDRLAALAD